MSGWLDITRIVLFCILYPVFFILNVLYTVLYTIATPFIALASLLIRFVLLPWRIAAKFEALWYFLLVAVVLGIVTAFILHLVFRGMVLLLRLDRPTPPKDIPRQGYDAVSYRAAREGKPKKMEEKEKARRENMKALASQQWLQDIVREAKLQGIAGPNRMPESPNTSTAATRRGLLTQTILEHSDEEDI